MRCEIYLTAANPQREVHRLALMADGLTAANLETSSVRFADGTWIFRYKTQLDAKAAMSSCWHHCKDNSVLDRKDTLKPDQRTFTFGDSIAKVVQCDDLFFPYNTLYKKILL